MPILELQTQMTMSTAEMSDFVLLPAQRGDRSVAAWQLGGRGGTWMSTLRILAPPPPHRRPLPLRQIVASPLRSLFQQQQLQQQQHQEVRQCRPRGEQMRLCRRLLSRGTFCERQWKERAESPFIYEKTACFQFGDEAVARRHTRWMPTSRDSTQICRLWSRVCRKTSPKSKPWQTVTSVTALQALRWSAKTSDLRGEFRTCMSSRPPCSLGRCPRFGGRSSASLGHNSWSVSRSNPSSAGASSSWPLRRQRRKEGWRLQSSVRPKDRGPAYSRWPWTSQAD
mmetsp:Transcript_1872/g.4714  ORF Transcript_1872/g.4714 Transcript_1872/m.4714 type:complete len:282 (+) Transcript_1872:43-888(+)